MKGPFWCRSSYRFTSACTVTHQSSLWTLPKKDKKANFLTLELVAIYRELNALFDSSLPTTMDSWMKRGFLKTAKSGSKPAASLTSKDSVDSGPAPRPADKPSPSLKIKIPSVPADYDDIPVTSEYNFPYGNVLNMRVTQLPFYGEPYTISVLYPGAKEAIATIPGFHTPYMPSLRVHYRIGDVPGIGKGMLALEDLNVGDLILRERPLFLFPVQWPQDSDQWEQPVMYALSMMQPADLRDFYELANCKPELANTVLGIIHTNSIDASRIPGDYNGGYGVVCRDLSRVNHSCVPNATYRWSLKDVMCELRASHPIKKGEQIFISYINPLSRRSARQQKLLSSYGFTCQCPSCTLPHSEAHRSDVRRDILRRKQDDDSALEAWVKDKSLPDDYIISQSMIIVNIMDAEGILRYNISAVHYPRLAKAYCALEDIENAKLWAKRTALAFIAFNGDDYGWNKVADSPDSTDWWGLRKM